VTLYKSLVFCYTAQQQHPQIKLLTVVGRGLVTNEIKALYMCNTHN